MHIPDIILYLSYLRYLLYFFAFTLPIFLYWRAGKHELVDSEDSFDTIFLSIAAALVFGRVVHFVAHPEVFNFSIARFFFITTYGGIDFFGALLGIVVVNLLLHRKKIQRFADILDFAAAPVVFGLLLYTLARSVSNEQIGRFIPVRVDLVYALFYFVLFFILKRLATTKRHYGFFACVSACLLGAISLSHFILDQNPSLLFAKYDYHLIFGGTLFAVGAVSWYIAGARKVIVDAKSIFGAVFLSALRLRRILTSANEAGKFARSILLFPYFLIRSLYLFSLTITQEIASGVVDFCKVFKARK